MGNGYTLFFMPERQIDPKLERYLELCQRIYERMVRDGTWPWKTDIPIDDSTLSEDLVDSESPPEDI